MGTAGTTGSVISVCATESGGSYINFKDLVAGDSGTGSIAYFPTTSGIMIFKSGNLEMMRISNGKLGIGTLFPSAKLHVVGNAQLTGDTTITGNLVVSGSITESTPAAYSGQLDNTTSYSSQQLIRFSGGNPVNIGSCYNATTYLFTTPRAGYVKITAGLTGTGGSIYTVINGSTGSYLMNAGGAAAFGCAILACAAGDTIGIKTNGALTITTAGFGTCVIEML